jgi:hypothetical protein
MHDLNDLITAEIIKVISLCKKNETFTSNKITTIIPNSSFSHRIKIKQKSLNTKINRILEPWKDVGIVQEVDNSSDKPNEKNYQTSDRYRQIIKDRKLLDIYRAKREEQIWRDDQKLSAHQEAQKRMLNNTPRVEDDVVNELINKKSRAIQSEVENIAKVVNDRKILLEKRHGELRPQDTLNISRQQNSIYKNLRNLLDFSINDKKLFLEMIEISINALNSDNAICDSEKYEHFKELKKIYDLVKA